MPAAEDPSLCVTEDGRLLSFGLGQFSRLGLGLDEEDHVLPTQVQALANERVVAVAKAMAQHASWL